MLYWKLRLPNVLEFRSLCEVIDSFAVEKKRSHLHDLEHPGQFFPVDGVQVFQVDPSPAHARPNQVVLGAKCKKTDDQLLTGTHLNLQGHVWVVAQDGFHIGAKHSRELVQCVHLARVYDQVVPAHKIVASSR